MVNRNKAHTSPRDSLRIVIVGLADNNCKRWPQPIAFILCLLTLTACEFNPEPAPIKLTGSTMGTRYSIKIPMPPPDIDSVNLRHQIEDVLDDVNQTMSTYRDDSDLSQINQRASTDWQPIPEALYHIIDLANTVSHKSAGAFDVTVGPLVNLWGFGNDNALTPTIPDQHQINARLEYTGFQRLELLDSPFRLKKQHPHLQIDLSAIAKGHAVDRVADYLESTGIARYMVEIGGEIRVFGLNEHGKPWRLAIEKPVAGIRAIYRIVEMTQGSIATSGDYRNFFDRDGKRYSHTIDPRTGKPIVHDLASVSVLSHTAAYADAMATALMVLGPDAGYQLAEQEQLAAIFLIRSEKGFFEKSTTRFHQEVEK